MGVDRIGGGADGQHGPEDQFPAHPVPDRARAIQIPGEVISACEDSEGMSDPLFAALATFLFPGLEASVLPGQGLWEAGRMHINADASFLIPDRQAPTSHPHYTRNTHVSVAPGTSVSGTAPSAPFAALCRFFPLVFSTTATASG